MYLCDKQNEAFKDSKTYDGTFTYTLLNESDLIY